MRKIEIPTDTPYRADIQRRREETEERGGGCRETMEIEERMEARRAQTP